MITLNRPQSSSFCSVKTDVNETSVFHEASEGMPHRVSHQIHSGKLTGTEQTHPSNKSPCASTPGTDPANQFAALSADGLVDCMDPDCCLQSSCQNQPYCRGLPDPQDVISQSLQTPSQQAAKSFYDRISFLIGSDSTHVLPGESPFNKRLMLAFLIETRKGLENSSACVL